MLTQHHLTISTQGRGIQNITDDVAKILSQENIQGCGLCHIFIHHTSASLIINENYDPKVLTDLESFMTRLVPDGDKLYTHVEEGPDDMPSHVRSILTTSFLSVPITDGKLALGQWQALYLWEHRIKPYQRRLTITIITS